MIKHQAPDEPDLEARDDDDVIDPGGWYQHEITLALQRDLGNAVVKALTDLVQTAASSTDARVSACHSRYLEAKQALHVLQRHGKGKDAKLALKVAAP